LAACRAVLCASLWPDPVDALCPQVFRDAAADAVNGFSKAIRESETVQKIMGQTAGSFLALEKERIDAKNPAHWNTLRYLLFDFIAEFAAWEASTEPHFLETARKLTQAAHEALGGTQGTRPLVVDPFAGGGSIPLEALRIGADAFASDLNPVAVLLNKVVLEYIPKYGQRLADEVRKWGQWIKEQAEKELAEFYPKDSDGATPIAYLWARTITCEGPGCGAKLPLIGRALVAGRTEGGLSLSLTEQSDNKLKIGFIKGPAARNPKGTCKGFVATCPRSRCGYSTPKKSVQRQLTSQQGGADQSTLMAVLTLGPRGRQYRLAHPDDLKAFSHATRALGKWAQNAQDERPNPVPDEPIPMKDTHRAVGSQLPLYGFKSWGDLFNSRQKLAILVLQHVACEAHSELLRQNDENFARAIFLLLSFAIDKQADYLSSLCRWVSGGEFIAGTLAGEKKLSMICDFAEANPVGPGSGSWNNHIEWIARFLEREACASYSHGTVCRASADEQILPSDTASAMITDPPYYDSVPYADLSDFFYVWLKRTIYGVEQLPKESLTPKAREMTVNHPGNQDEKARYEALLTGAFVNGREVTVPSGVGVIVFAHKSTSGWETLIEAIIKSGWTVTASWPIDTERSVRLNAIQTASLGSSVHIVCRPRENPDGSVRDDDIGDWRDVLRELPVRIHEWLPRLADEGVVGADAIFACLGPALEIFSRYSRVEKASGELMTLREYLEQVWAAVSKEALMLVFKDADTSAFEEDARLTAMWLWTLSAGGNGASGSDADSADTEEDSGTDDDESDSKVSKVSGYTLEYDAARKIAQGLGAHLEALTSLVEVKGDKATLLPVLARTRKLFGKEETQTERLKDLKAAKKSRLKQMDMFITLEELEAEEDARVQSVVEGPPAPGNTVLDRVHQAMILFSAGRSEAMKRFLVEEGIGNDPRFWSLAQALSALYPTSSDEKRWVDGILARKKGLGF
jgi:putative DNA methylase